ncbi:hypothetical protein DFJ74DRAFT_674106 [Hyaloraphidium curvatum]|nr:hypothetical protein DFJ74DRAFT_674106 [Hyaloraphidium curvatum]
MSSNTALIAARSVTFPFIAVMLASAANALFRPLVAAKRFGLPRDEADDGAFVRVYASRNTAIAIAVAVLAGLGEARGTAVLVTCTVPLTVFDAVLVRVRKVEGPRPYYLHAGIGVILGLISGLWWWAASV